MDYKVVMTDANGRQLNVSFSISDDEIEKMAKDLRKEQIEEYMKENNLGYEEARRSLAEQFLYKLKLVGHE